jgi:hypothetical protein
VKDHAAPPAPPRAFPCGVWGGKVHRLGSSEHDAIDAVMLSDLEESVPVAHTFTRPSECVEIVLASEEELNLSLFAR